MPDAMSHYEYHGRFGSLGRSLRRAWIRFLLWIDEREEYDVSRKESLMSEDHRIKRQAAKEYERALSTAAPEDEPGVAAKPSKPAQGKHHTALGEKERIEKQLAEERAKRKGKK